jgi:hypothetical protein
MLTRSDILSKAVDSCMKELYSYVQPRVEWEDFIGQNKMYSNKYLLWEKTKDLDPNYIGKSLVECIGPRPYEFYYLPKDILKDIIDNYVYVYKIDNQQNLLDIIEILKNYCKEPIIDKWIEGENGFPGHRGYEHPDNLEKEITKILGPEAEDNPYHVHKICDKFFEFLDMAGNFFNWNRDLNSFNTTIYLGYSPNSSKEAVIKNWKEYRNKDIEINEEQMKKDYYGEEDYD